MDDKQREQKTGDGTQKLRDEESLNERGEQEEAEQTKNEKATEEEMDSW